MKRLPSATTLTLSVVLLLAAIAVGTYELMAAMPPSNDTTLLIRKLDETNRQLDRIADALEIVAGTGSRSWTAPK